METTSGIITTVFLKRYFGFILSETGESLFFSSQGVIEPKFKELREGHQVEFLRVEDPDGRAKAIAVVVV